VAKTITHRAGDTFSRSATWKVGGVAVDLTGYTVACDIVTAAGRTLVDAADVTIDADQVANQGKFTIEVLDTDAWSPGVRLAFFVRFTSPSGHKRSSPWCLIDVLADAPEAA
jgi:hypothetical protein